MHWVRALSSDGLHAILRLRQNKHAHGTVLRVFWRGPGSLWRLFSYFSPLVAVQGGVAEAEMDGCWMNDADGGRERWPLDASMAHAIDILLRSSATRGGGACLWSLYCG